MHEKDAKGWAWPYDRSGLLWVKFHQLFSQWKSLFLFWIKELAPHSMSYVVIIWSTLISCPSAARRQRLATEVIERVGGRLRDQSHFGHGVTKTHRKNFKKKRKIFFRKISLFANFDFSSVKREPRTQRRFSKRNARERRQRLSVEHARSLESFVCFAPKLSYFFSWIYLSYSFCVLKKLFEASLQFWARFENLKFQEKSGRLRVQLDTACPILDTACPI